MGSGRGEEGRWRYGNMFSLPGGRNRNTTPAACGGLGTLRLPRTSSPVAALVVS